MADKRIRVTADDSALATLQQRIGSFYQSLESDSESWREKSYQDISSIIDQFSELQQAREEFAQARTISVEQNGSLDSGLTDIDRIINEKINQAVAAYRQERVESGMRDLPWDRPADTNNREVIGADKPKETEERVVRQVDETVTREVTEIIKPVEEEAGEQPRNPFDVADETVREEIDDDLARRRAERYKPLTEEEQAEKKKLYADLGWEEEDEDVIDRNAVVDEYEDGSMESQEDTRLRYQRERLYAARAASEREARRRRAEEDRQRQEEERRRRSEESGRDEVEVEEEPVEEEAGGRTEGGESRRREYVSPERKLQAELAKFRQELEGQDWENMSEDDMNSYWDRTDAFRDRVRQMNGGRYGAREMAQYRDLEESDTYLAERTRERIEREQASVQPDTSGGGEQGVNSPLTRLVQRIFELLRLRQNNDDTVGGERIVDDGDGDGGGERRGSFFENLFEGEGKGVDWTQLGGSMMSGDIAGMFKAFAPLAGLGMLVQGGLKLNEMAQNRRLEMVTADSSIDSELASLQNSLAYRVLNINKADSGIAQDALSQYRQNRDAQYQMSVITGGDMEQGWAGMIKGIGGEGEIVNLGVSKETTRETVTDSSLIGGGAGLASSAATAALLFGLSNPIGWAGLAAGGLAFGLGAGALFGKSTADKIAEEANQRYKTWGSDVLGMNVAEEARDYTVYYKAGVYADPLDKETQESIRQSQIARKAYDLDQGTQSQAYVVTRYGTEETQVGKIEAMLRANLRENGYSEGQTGVMLGENLTAYTQLARAFTQTAGKVDQDWVTSIITNLTDAGYEGEQVGMMAQAFTGLGRPTTDVGKSIRMQAISDLGLGKDYLSYQKEMENASPEVVKREFETYLRQGQEGFYGFFKDDLSATQIYDLWNNAEGPIKRDKAGNIQRDALGNIELNEEWFTKENIEKYKSAKFSEEEAKAKVTDDERDMKSKESLDIMKGKAIGDAAGDPEKIRDLITSSKAVMGEVKTSLGNMDVTLKTLNATLVKGIKVNVNQRR